MSLQEVKYLKVQNSYIFLNSPYKKKDNPHRNQDNVIVLDVGRHVFSFIKTCFPKVCKVAADDDTYFYRTEYSCIISDDDVSFKGQALLSFQILLLEFRAAAKGYDFVFADHNIKVSLRF